VLPPAAANVSAVKAGEELGGVTMITFFGGSSGAAIGVLIYPASICKD